MIPLCFLRRQGNGQFKNVFKCQKEWKKNIKLSLVYFNFSFIWRHMTIWTCNRKFPFFHFYILLQTYSVHSVFTLYSRYNDWFCWRIEKRDSMRKHILIKFMRSSILHNPNREKWKSKVIWNWVLWKIEIYIAHLMWTSGRERSEYIEEITNKVKI